jgi:gliding motility-associated-like protein
MKNKSFCFFSGSFRGIFLTVLLLMLVQHISFAQLAVYPLRTAHSSNNNTPAGQAQVSLTNPNVNALTMVPGANMEPSNFNATGFRTRSNNIPWATSPTDGWGIDIPISPDLGWDMNISGITMDITDSDFDVTGSFITIVPFFQVDGAGPWLPLAGQRTVNTDPLTINFGAINETFYSGHTYVIRFYMFNSDGSNAARGDYLRIFNLRIEGTVYQPIAQPVSVSTLTAAATGKYTADATGSYSFNGNQFYLVKQSGFIWTSVSAAALLALDTSASTKTSNGSAGVINSTLTGLTAGTTYWVRAYIVTQFGIQYGATLSFTTDAPSAPVVTTNAVTNILSNKATGGGVIVDSGGVAITAKGMVWGFTPGATVTTNIGKVTLNGGSEPFSDFMKQLTPNTTYCYRAFATNALGTSYGGDSCFTTAAPAPVLVAIPGSIDFGINYFGANPVTVSYTLTGSNLTPNGTINISIAPAAGYQISLTSGSGYGTSLSIPYTGTSLPRRPIFVRFLTSAYGTFNSVISHSGGGVAAVDADQVTVKGVILQSPDDVTNKGEDFWLGFAYQNRMTQNSSSTSKPYLTVYVATGNQSANVTVETPGIPGGYLQTATIPANSTRAFTNFPDGLIPGVDSRLFATGISSKAVHVFSTNGAPISVWMYIATTGNSAGGSMIFPTSTWNSTYTVQAYAGKSNNGLPNSNFFVIANEDNTQVTINPSSGIISPAGALQDNPAVLYPANVPFTITLNRGQVFNAVGVITGSGNAATSSGFDLSGTTVSTTCDKKIAVFGGNGRCMVTTPVTCTENSVSAGSDNMVQQMIPSVAWDTRYFTVPTKTMETNLFRIYVRNAAQDVQINGGTPLAKTAGPNNGAGNGFVGHYSFRPFVNSPGGYYALETNRPIQIDSEEPMSVTQFITAGDCAVNTTVTGNNGGGDPEMIILTGAQQAITNAVVYSPNFQNGASGAGYINVVIPTAGVASFRLDPTTNPTQMVDTGRSSFIAGQQYQAAPLIPIVNAFKPYSANPDYSWAKFKVSYPTTHIMSSTVPFNAIAYGVAQGESYGFNAGTAVKNLSSYKISVNPGGNDSSSTVIRTCVNTPITLKIAFPYNPTLVNRIEWAANDARVSPNNVLTGPVSGGVAVHDGTIDIGGRTFYVYTSPVQYTFSANALYNFKVTAFGTFASDCPGEDQQTMLINVGQDLLNLSANPACNNPTVVFTADTIPMVGTNILSWSWDFGHGTPVTTGTLSPQSYTYPTGGQTAYTVKLTTRNTVGCVSTDSLAIDFGGGLESLFTISKDAVCANEPVTFTDASFGSGTSGSPSDWQWDFDNGQTHSGQTPPPQTWTTPGIKTISLTVSTAIGCVKTFKDTVTVEATPVAAINASPAVVCLGSSAAYSDASTISIGTITGWVWNFDDGTSSTLQNPNKIWATAGNHTTTLTVTSAGGCASTNTATHIINVNPLPIPGFRYDLNCTTRTLTATDTSNANGGTITSWEWDFGDGGTSTVQNPSHVYAASGTYTVTLAVTTANGCRSATPVSITVTIAASPVADFTLPGNTCLPSASPVFTNTTSISDGTLAQVTYIWNFGDGTGDFNAPSVIPVSPTHVFPGTGPYTVSLTAISNNGCTNTITKPYSAIFAQPVAVISPQAELCVGGTVNFSSATSTAAGSTVTGWLWDFGDGSPTSTVQNPTHTYTTAGVKTVQLTVTSAAGCSSAIDTVLVTVNQAPTANFSDTINCTTRSVGFTDLSVANSGNVTQWAWNFGDNGATSTVQNPTHVFSNEGDYTVTLTVTTDKGCSNSTPFSQLVRVNARPVADFTLPGNVCLPNASASFTNTTGISDGTLPQVTYVWNFGDGSPTVTSPASPTHTYTGVGPFTVTLTATSNNGCVHTASKVYSGIFAQPVAVITAPAGVCLGNAATFSSASSTAPASTVTGWQWNFGDTPAPGTSADQNPTYTYTGSGPRTVTLTVTSAAGCTSAAATQAIDVNLSPVAAFTYSTIRCEDSLVTFTDASVSNAAGGITEWNWNFGDGGTLTQTTAGPVTHAFANSQSYTVSLTLKNANGCVTARAYTTPVVINPNPVSLFTVSNICIPAGLASFTQQATISTGQVTGWNWDFGVTGATSTQANPAYNYATGGVYQVTLRVSSDSSCTASFTLPVTAYNSPTPLFDVTSAANLCSNLPVSIVNKSVVTGFGTVDKLEIFWDYANSPTVNTTINTPSLDQVFTNQYPVFGDQPSKVYNVLIRAYSGAGCSTDYAANITLLAAPKVQFTQPAPVCQEASSFNLTTATDIFGLPGTGIYSGTGVTSSPAFDPSNAGFGTHTIRYTYTTANGCSDFAEQPIVVNPTPVINFGRSTINVLEGDVLTLAPTITNGSSYLWTPSTYLNSATSPTPSGSPANDIIYNLLVTSGQGCIGESSVLVKVVRNYVVPNTFTPNGDGNHDRWEIENLVNYPDVRVRIFSRAGQLVFESYGYNTPWDGRYKGTDMPFGTYYYVIETGGGRKPRTGYVTIIR